MLTTVLAFLVAIGILVTFHELGHYWVARRAGIHVLRFSVGFGKPLFSWRDRHGTEWTLAPIPVGGYVKMLDSYEPQMPEAWRAHTFAAQPVLARMAVVAAGPAANLLLAVVFYAALAWSGTDALRPLVGTVLPDTPAAEAGVKSGDRVERVNETTVEDWVGLRLALLDALSQPEQAIQLHTEYGTRTLPPPNERGLSAEPAAVAGLGLLPQRLLPQVAALEPDSPAFHAGLRIGDTIEAVGSHPVKEWGDLVRALRQQGQPQQPLLLTIQRGEQRFTVSVIPNWVDAPNGQRIPRIGVAPQVDAAWLAQLQFEQQAGPIDGLVVAVSRTWRDVRLSFSMFYRMVLGDVSLQNLSGPLTIADFAGQTARRGLSSYIEFLALISVSLAVLNLLPIPMLDGGHLLYHVAELVKGKPLSEQAQAFGYRVGLVLLLTLMLFAIFNDFNRLFAG